MPQLHYQTHAEPRRGELDAADLRRRDDVSGDADDEQVAEALVEDDLRRHPGVRAPEDDREWFLLRRQAVAARRARERVRVPHGRDKATVPGFQTFECVSR